MEKCGNLSRRDSRLLAGTAAAHAGGTTNGGCRGAEEMRACSACAGDYEDPDRTAWTPEEPDADEGGDDPAESTEEFPAEK